MNIDERIEALAQSLELLGHIQRDNDARFEERFARFEERVTRLEENLAKVTGAVDKLVNVVEKLTAVALSHEERIERLEKE